MFKDMIGKRSEKVVNVVERGAVKKFCEAIGDIHPIYVDADYAAESRYKQNIAPPTFPVTFSYGQVEGSDKMPRAGLIHGEQQFQYNRPLFIGEEIFCYSEIEDYYEREGSSGTLAFMVRRNRGESASGELIFSSRSVTIITEAVRKNM